MATNAPARKPSNVLSSRLSYKPLKLEMPQLARAYQPPTIVSVNAKDANKDKDKDKDRKQKMAVTKQSSNPKSYSKRTEAPATAAASASVQMAGQGKVTKVTSNERTVVLARHVDQAQYGKQARKPKLDGAASRTKNLRPTPAETALPTNKHAKESKSPDKADAAAQRQIRSKNQSHNTKIFFDKYLKFAYDLTTPDGVRQLEAHFFPADNHANRQTRKKSESGDTSEKPLPGGEERLSSVSMHTNSTVQVLQQGKCCDAKDK
ncbi:PREDICTED: uncharacterized protein LOC108611360 [Drosophila arizonae]|uniref:Uncharacterized protein LOC108611360 n=1 Tax=Drosophila arizonae TaxID=7263 RepID=A0ABM1NWV1_DROAR|nr:PREDICTED: uncharacterized protein LOC108611360 [Drosophila arizonae]